MHHHCAYMQAICATICIAAEQAGPGNRVSEVLALAYNTVHEVFRTHVKSNLHCDLHRETGQSTAEQSQD